MQALRLFAASRVSAHPGVAAASQRALTACEALLHPRATPLTGVRAAYAGAPRCQIKLLSPMQAGPCGPGPLLLKPQGKSDVGDKQCACKHMLCLA
jgi:cytochrome c551/c552